MYILVETRVGNSLSDARIKSVTVSWFPPLDVISPGTNVLDRDPKRLFNDNFLPP